MDKLIQKLSLFMSNLIQNKLKWSDEKKEELHFLLQYFIFYILVFGTIFITSGILGLFKECLIITTIFCYLRSSAGGFHCDSWSQCYIISNIYILLCSFISHKFINSPLSYFPLVIIAIISIFYIYFKYVPKPNKYDENMFITREEKKNKFVKSIYVLISLCGIGLFLCSKLFVVSVSIAALSVSFITSDLGESIFNKMQQYIKI